VIEIDGELAKDILAKRELFQMVKSKSSDVLDMRFWDGATTWHDTLDEIKHLLPGSIEDAEAHVENEPFLRLKDDGEIPDGQRTECDMLLIGENYFEWRAVPKHASFHVETSGIRYEVLL
jgi:hypothetical protein